MLEIILILLGMVLLMLGLAGSVFPVLPGPLLGWLALVLVQCTDRPHFSFLFLLALAALALAGSFVDDILPHVGARYAGGSRQAVFGSILGMIAGMLAGLVFGVFLTPVCMLAGTLFGAYAGEYPVSRNSAKAVKVALGVFAGFALAMTIRFAICLAFAILFVVRVFFA
jgi:uncharacterized protein YqgC (DUF456 family)